MSQSERIRYIQEQANQIVSRNKCVDSSLYTMKQQAKASKRVIAPVAVAAVADVANCPTNITIKGKGVNMEYTGILQAAQACAICADVEGGPAVITLPTPCIDNEKTPFAQQTIKAGYPAPYVAPCSNPGNQNYFPTITKRGDDCTLEHLPYDS